MTAKMQTTLEVAGFTCAALGAACVGWVLAGAVLAAGLGLLVAAAALILVGNI